LGIESLFEYLFINWLYCVFGGTEWLSSF
jgi:hypothetical protein